jgi:hypothetical protein
MPVGSVISKGLKNFADDSHMIVKEFDKLGDEVYNRPFSEEAKQAHVRRGRLGYLYHSGAENATLSPDPLLEGYHKLIKQYGSIRNAPEQEVLDLVYRTEGVKLDHAGYIDDLLLDASEGPLPIKSFGQSKVKLDKPLYIARVRGAIGGDDSPEQLDHMYSALVIDEETYKNATKYGDNANIYKLEPGAEIYHPMGLADPNEVVISGNQLHMAKSASFEEFNEAVKKGTPLFSLVGATTLGTSLYSEDSEAMPVASVISKGLDIFQQAPKQVQKQIDEGSEQGIKYLEGRGVKRQEIDQLTQGPDLTDDELAKLDADDEAARALGIPGYAEDVFSMNQMKREELLAQGSTQTLGKPGVDPYAVKQLPRQYDSVTPPDLNSDAYEEVGYTLSQGMLTDVAKEQSDHWFAGTTAHVRRDTKDGALRVFEIQSDVQNKISNIANSSLTDKIDRLFQENSEFSDGVNSTLRTYLVQLVREYVQNPETLTAVPLEHKELVTKVAAELRNQPKPKMSQYNINWDKDVINRQFVDAANQGLDKVDFLITPAGRYMARSEKVQANYETRVKKQIENLAKKLKGPNGEKATVEIVGTSTPTPNFSKIARALLEDQPELANKILQENYFDESTMHPALYLTGILRNNVDQPEVAELIKQYPDLVRAVHNVQAPTTVRLEDAPYEMFPALEREVYNPGLAGVPLETKQAMHKALQELEAKEPDVYKAYVIDAIDLLDGDSPEEIFRASHMQGTGLEEAINPQYAVDIVNSLVDRSKGDVYLRVNLPKTAAGAAAAFSVPAFAQESEESKQANLGKRVTKAVEDGAPPSEVFKSLQQSGYELPMIQSALGKAATPKIEQMRADGVPDEEIVGIMQSIGIVPSAPYASATDTINSVIGQQGPMEESPTTMTTGAPEIDKSPISALDVNADIKQVNLDKPAHEVISDLRNIHSSTVRTFKELAVDFNLIDDPEFVQRVRDERAAINKVMLMELNARGIKAVGYDEEGRVLIETPEGVGPVDEETILESLGQVSAEITGSISGGMVAGPIGFFVGGPIGFFVGATTGASIGAGFGKGVDVLKSAQDIKYDLDVIDLKSKMQEAAYMDAVLGVTGTALIGGTIKVTKGTVKIIGRSYDLLIGGNKQGAMQALKDTLNISDQEAISIVERWENLNNVKVLSKQARETGQINNKDFNIVAQVLAETQPDAVGLAKSAAQVSKTKGSIMAASINQRAKDLQKQVSVATTDNIGVVLKDGLNTYNATVKKDFDTIKMLGIDLMKDTGYRFNFNQTPIRAAFEEFDSKLLDSELRKQFYPYLQAIRAQGNDEAVKSIQKQAKQFEQAKGLKNVTPKINEQTIEANNPLRGFENLIELRHIINEVSNVKRFASHRNFKTLEAAKKSIDAEIARAAKANMPNADTWLKEWKGVNTEYSKMKALESNVLYKAITKPEANTDQIVKALIGKGMKADESEVFMSVLGKLPTSVRRNTENSIIKHLVDNTTVGYEGGRQAIDFTKLSDSLKGLDFTQLEARNMKRTIDEFAKVYKSDPYVLMVTGNVPLPKFQSYLTADPIVRLKFEIASHMFNAVKSRMPFSAKSGQIALVEDVAKLIENPLDATTTKKVMAQLGDDPQLKTMLHKLATQYVEKGVPENYGKVKLYRVAKPGSQGKAGDTQLGRGVMYYTDKAKAQQIAKGTGAKVYEEWKPHKLVATPEDVSKLLEREADVTDLKAPEVRMNLERQNKQGIAYEDKVLIFK